MKKVLITGSRNIIALDLANTLHRHGYLVYLADTWHFPMIKRAKSVQDYCRLPSPRFNLQAYYAQLSKYIRAHDIDLIIPMCEEAFYLSALKEKLSADCEVFTPDLLLMDKLHNKFKILELAKGCGIELPKTVQLKSKQDLLEFPGQETIIKPEYSRFGHDVLTGVEALKKVDILLKDGNYLVQEKIKGQEFCTYALCRDGHVLCQTVYQPIYRLPHSASMYFKRIAHKKIECFVINFVKKNNITGQVAFDIIDNGTDIYLIECNPRGSSGIHLLSQVDFGALLFSQQASNSEPKPKTENLVMLGYAMWLVMLPRLIVRGRFAEWQQAVSSARNVLKCGGYKILSIATMSTILEMFAIMIKSKKGFRAASTYDIEWNGKEINTGW